MKSLARIFLPFLVFGMISSAQAFSQETQTPGKLHGKALKEKEASIEILQGLPTRPFQKLAPIWASKGSMEATMKDIRKQTAKIGADAIIDVRVKTEKLEKTYEDPGFWAGPGAWGGWGPWGGPWGGIGYWGGYVQSHTYNQPVVSGWAVKWTGPPPAGEKEVMPTPSLEEQVEDAPAD